VVQSTPPLRVCQQCSTPLPEAMQVGRPRQFCSPTCRSAARRARSRASATSCEFEVAGTRCGSPATDSIVIIDQELSVCASCAELLQSWLARRNAPAPTEAGVEIDADIKDSDDRALIVQQSRQVAVAPTSVVPAQPGLSPREREIVRLFAEGRVAENVARQTNLTVSTVRQYLERARSKYDAVNRPARTRVELYKRAIEDELLSGAATSSALEVSSVAARTEEQSATQLMFSDVVVQAAVAGDRNAIDRLLRTLRPLVVKYCRARVVRSAGNADDVAQEVCLAVLTALPNYRDQGRPFLSFVYGIAAHKVADAHRALSRSRAESVAALPEETELAPGPEQYVVGSDEDQRLLGLLHRLPERHREVVVLRVLVGLTSKEVAEALNISPRTVINYQSNALNKMRELLAEESFGNSLSERY
jgi:RNA polymerase sigma-70 factor, ECF subfamily